MNPYLAGGAAAFQLITGFQQGEMVREQGKITKEIHDMNAELAELDAWQAERDGDAAVARYEQEVDDVVADQKVAYAAKDVDVNFGSAANIVEETKLAGMLNAMDIKNQARQQALGYKRQARQMRLTGSAAMSQAEMNAGAMRASAVMGAAETGIKAYSGYDKTKKAK